MLPQNITDYGYDCHSCNHCTNILLDSRQKSETQVSNQNFTDAIKADCRFYTWVFVILRRDLERVKSAVTALSEDDEEFQRLTAEQRRILLKFSSESLIDNLEFLSPEHSVTVTFEVESPFQFSSRDQFEKRTKISIHYTISKDFLDSLWGGEAAPGISQQLNYLKSDFTEKSIMTRSTQMRGFVLPDRAESVHISNRPRYGTLSSDSSLSIARRWLEECREGHKECHISNDGMPRRVLDVGSGNNLLDIKLHATREGQSDPYAALTYCWGGEQLVKVVKANLEQLQDGINLDLLPKTIKDAVRVTRGLGIRYLWVDCLCIIQDDDADLTREIANMASVFLGATITISASTAKGSTEGFLDMGKIHCISLTGGVDGGASFPVYLEWSPQYYGRSEVLATRAWTLQERILSTRILDYCGRGMWWFCHTGGRSEVGTFGQNGPPTYFYHPPRVLRQHHPGDMRSLEGHTVTGARYRPTPIRAWRGTVEEYSKRKMAFGKDKLLAVSGIAAEYEKLFQSEYLAGLWQFDIISELLWYTNPSLPGIPRPHWRAPSWSWAAVDGEVKLMSFIGDEKTNLIIHEAKALPVSKNAPFGAVQPDQSYLIVEGFLRHVWVKTDVNYKNLFNTKDSGTSIGGSFIDALELQAAESDNRTSAWALFFVESGRGLLLACTEKDVYRRMGTLSFSFEHKQVWSEGRELRRVKII